MTTTPPSLPAGWYPDQHDARLLRYWDGNVWTEHTHPAPPLQSSPLTDAPRPAAGRATPASPGPRAVPWWQTWWVIVPSLLLCFPIGLVSMWMRSGVGLLTKSLVSTLVAAVAVAAVVSGDPEPTAADEAAVEVRPSPSSGSPSAAEPSTDASEEPPAETQPEKSVVPRVVDGRLAEARAELARADLGVRVIDRLSWRPSGTVLEQRARPGAKVSPGKTVVLVVAAPMPEVPGVVGRGEEAAADSLRTAGFQVTTTAEAVTTGPGGVVLRQSTPGGEQAEPGTTITLVVSRRIQPVAPPAPTNCTAGYSPCLPPMSDYDCEGGSGDGPGYTGLVEVTGPDPYDLDADGDGVACEPW